MFQSVLGNVLEAVSALLFWSWSNPTFAGLALSAFAISVIVWLHVPHQLVYYWKDGQITVQPFNIRNEIPQSVSGRRHVLRFARKHGISLALGRRTTRTLIEFCLKVIGIPDPLQFSWDGSFAAIQVYPLGHCRREYLRLCRHLRMWPWKRAATLHTILDANDGYLPGLQLETALVSLVNRVHSHS